MINSQTFSGPLHEKSYRYALRIVLFCKDLIQVQKEFVLSKQLMRAGTSVGANIEEAQQAQSRADFSSKMAIALKECCESRYWLRLLLDAGYADLEKMHPLIVDAEQIIKMLSQTVKTSKGEK